MSQIPPVDSSLKGLGIGACEIGESLAFGVWGAHHEGFSLEYRRA